MCSGCGWAVRCLGAAMLQPPSCHRCGAAPADHPAEWCAGWLDAEPLRLMFCATCYREAITGTGEVGVDGGEWPQVVLEIFEGSEVKAR